MKTLRSLRLRLSLLGELPAWVWLLAMLVAGAGCDATLGDGSTGAALVASLGGFAYAVRVRVTADARTAGAVVDALAARDAELARMSARLDAAHERERATDRRCDALQLEIEELRRVLRSGHHHSNN